MQRVHKLGRRRVNLLLAPLAALVTAATFLLWPQPAAQLALVATRDVAASEYLTARDFALQAVNLGESASLYLHELPPNHYALNQLAKGELLSRTAIAPSPLELLLPTVLEFNDALPSKLRVGSQVDVWAGYRELTPEPIALDCQVLALQNNSSLGQKTHSVEVGCLSEFLPELLRAKANQAEINLVLQPTSLDE